MLYALQQGQDTENLVARLRHSMEGAVRSREFITTLKSVDPNIGSLIDRAHISCRDYLGNTTVEMDDAIACLKAKGMYGGCVNGAGFGGTVVGIAPKDVAPRYCGGCSGRIR